jgi:hypothetical protein
MKDILEKILEYLPMYLMDFGSLLSGPKSFLAQKRAQVDRAFGDSLLFLGISVAITIIAPASLELPGKDLWTNVGSIGFVSLLAVCLSASAVRLAWRMVGGKAPAVEFFIIDAYLYGLSLIIFQVFFLVATGIFKEFDPQLYTRLFEKREQIPNADVSYALFAWYGIILLGLFVCFVWWLVGWGAYRNLNGLSRARSVCALFISIFLNILITAIIYFVSKALF